jgi:hypothetical protein
MNEMKRLNAVKEDSPLFLLIGALDMKVKKERASRVEDSREASTRRHEIRERLKMSYFGPMDIDPRDVPEGKEYRVVRIDIFDKPDNGRLPEMSRQGWEVVPASRHPSMVFLDPLGRNSNTKNYIYHKGGILCERDKDLGEIQYKALEERNLNDLLNMPGTENFLGEPSIPGTNSGNTYFTRNATFGK